VSTQKPISDYRVLEILKTTDKELKPSVGKCLVQKLKKDHQTITVPDDYLVQLIKHPIL
jgi:hypothetical protein